MVTRNMMQLSYLEISVQDFLLDLHLETVMCGAYKSTLAGFQSSCFLDSYLDGTSHKATW